MKKSEALPDLSAASGTTGEEAGNRCGKRLLLGMSNQKIFSDQGKITFQKKENMVFLIIVEKDFCGLKQKVQNT